MALHPHRLSPEHYRGRFTHFLTACTYQRRPLFRQADLATAATDHLMRACRQHGFADIAHTLMPDHVHVLVEGLRLDSDFIKWLDLWRQLCGYWHKRRGRDELWQEGYWDYTLRDRTDVMPIASYIVWNPVVAGIVDDPTQYPYTGSDRFSISELAAVPPKKPRVGDC